MIELLGHLARDSLVPDELTVAVEDGGAGGGNVEVKREVEAGRDVGLACEANEWATGADAKEAARRLEIKDCLRVGGADQVLRVGLPKMERSVKVAGKELGHGGLSSGLCDVVP